MSTMPPTSKRTRKRTRTDDNAEPTIQDPSPPLANVEPTIQETPPLVEVSDETNSTEINETNSNTHEETNVLTNVHSSPIETVTERNFNFQQVIASISTVDNQSLLKDKISYDHWFSTLKENAIMISPDFLDFINQDTMDLQQYPTVYQTFLDRLICATIDPHIKQSLKYRKLSGKKMLSEIISQFGSMTIKDKVNYSIIMATKIHSDVTTHLDKMNLLAQFYAFLMRQPQDLKPALLLIAGINDSRFNETYFHDNKELTISKLERYIINQNSKITPSVPTPSPRDAVTGLLVTQPTSALGQSEVFNTQCFNCFGLGHTARRCASPKRLGQINNLRSKLLAFETRSKSRKRFPPQPPPTNRSANSTIITNPSPTDDTISSTTEDSFPRDVFGWAASSDQIKSKDNLSLFFDTGASAHLINNLNLLHDYKPSKENKHVITANGDKIPILGTGTVKLQHGQHKISLRNCQYSPHLHINLISPRLLLDDSTSMTITQSGIYHSKIGQIGYYSTEDGNLIKCMFRPITIPHLSLYSQYVEMGLQSNNVLRNIPAFTVHIPQLHDSLGHTSTQQVSNVMKRFNVTTDNIGTDCETCRLGKAITQIPKISTHTISSHCLELLHVDVHGPISVPSIFQERYFLVILDDYSKYLTVQPLCNKSDATAEIIEFINHWEKFFLGNGNYHTKILRSDNGGEFLNKTLTTYLDSKYITHQTSNAYEHHENGAAERAIRSVKDMARVILLQSKLPVPFWSLATRCAAFVMNRLPHKTINGKIPYEVWTKQLVNLKMMKPFGSQVYVKIPIGVKSFSAQALSGIMVGYATNKKGYLVYDPTQNRIFTSSQIICHPSIYPAANLTFNEPLIISSKVTAAHLHPLTISNLVIPPTNAVSETPLANCVLSSNSSVCPKVCQLQTVLEHGEDKIYALIIPISIGNMKRTRTNENKICQLDESNNTTIPDSVILSANNVLLNLESRSSIPKSYKEAITSNEKSKWADAMDSEFNSLQSNNTWSLEPLPEGRKAIGVKWVYTIKDTGRYKARLVALGYRQQAGVDFLETYAPVIRGESIKLIFALASKSKLKIHSIDVTTAFLNGEILELIFVKQPPGYEDKKRPNHVCKLNRSLYGLKQLPLMWNIKLNDVLIKEGFRRLGGDLGIYISKDKRTIMGVYVDDILICGPSDSEIEQVKNNVRKYFSITDNGLCRKFLGINVYQQANEIRLSLNDYIRRMIEELKLSVSETNPVSIPSDVNYEIFKVNENDDEKPCDQTKYRSLIGKLLFASNTIRFDIAYSVNSLSRFINDPKEKHWIAAVKVVKYLSGTQRYGICYNGNGDLNIYADSDWASTPSDRKSITGYIVTYAGAPISWRSKKQNVIALSTTEAEFMALTESIKEALWLIYIFRDINVILKLPIVIYEDNLLCQKLLENPRFHNRTKHIDLKYKFTKDHIEAGTIKVESTNSADNLADMLTKPLPKIKFKHLRWLAGLRPLD